MGGAYFDDGKPGSDDASSKPPSPGISSVPSLEQSLSSTSMFGWIKIPSVVTCLKVVKYYRKENVLKS